MREATLDQPDMMWLQFRRRLDKLQPFCRDLKRLLDSGIGRVECPDCACTRTLTPQGRALQFKSHDKRKTSTPNTGPRWVRVETDWDVVGG